MPARTFSSLFSRTVSMVGLALTLVLSGTADAQELFVQPPPTTTERNLDLPASPPDPATLRQRRVEVDLGALKARTRFVGPDLRIDAPLVLNLFEDARFEVVPTRVEGTPTQFRWTGRVTDEATSLVVLVTEGDRLVGNIRLGERLFSVRPAAGGLHRIVEIDVDALPQEEPPRRVPDRGLEDSGDGETPTAANDAPVEVGTGPFVNLLVVYTPEAASAAGGAIEAEIEVAVIEANTAYENSGIRHRLHLVGMIQTEESEDGEAELGLGALTDPDDSVLDDVHPLRDRLQADAVALLTRSGCGVAWYRRPVVPSFASHAFSAVGRGCVNGQLTLAHELGHNMGANHDRYVVDNGDSSTDHNFGYVDLDEGWRTVMAYGTACSDAETRCPRLPYWSNPDVSYDGSPMGVEDGDSDAADNRKTLGQSASTVSRFRTLGVNEDGDLFGAVMSRGDFDGDGLDDLAVAAPGEAPGGDPASGAIFLFHGTAFGPAPWQSFTQNGLGANEEGDDFGLAMVSGDFDGDGFDDLAVGAPGEAPADEPASGWVFLFRGSATGLAPWTGIGQQGLGANETGDRFGEALASGDFDGDGFDDLAVGAPGEAPGSDPQSGWVFLFHGSPGGLERWYGLGQGGLGANEAGDRFGATLTSGDFDGDGHDDLAVGAPGEAPGDDPASGWVFVFRGEASGPQPWFGLGQNGLGANEAGDLFGDSLASGDFDGDGRDDLAVGAPGEAPGSEPKSGWAFVFRGTRDGLTPWSSFGQKGLGANELDDRFAASLSAADFDGDGRDDLAVGAPNEAPGSEPASGWFFLFRGTGEGLEPWMGRGQRGLGANEAADRFAAALAAGDFNGDGLFDLAVGAPGEAPGSEPESGYVFVFGTRAGELAPWRGLHQEQ